MTRSQDDDFLDRRPTASAGQTPDDKLKPGGTHLEEADSRRDVADLLWEAAHGAPPLREDPVAAMLGLIPDPAYALDSKKLRQARRRARLQASELVARLNTRGWQVSGGDIYRWENQSAIDVPPALINAIAEETDSNVDQLTTSQAKVAVPSAVVTVLSSAAFEALAQRWAKLQNVSRALAISQLESRMLTTVYRGDHADADQMLESLEALLTASERARELPHES